MIVAANWKMHKGIAEAEAWARDVVPAVPDGVEAIVFPPSTAIWAVHLAIGGGPLRVGIQNIFYENAGAFTGEISPAMALDAGCTYALIGHSERRQILGETDRDIAVKLRFVLGTELRPVLCIGESVEDFDRGDTAGAIRRQLGVALKGLSAEDVRRVVVAYEPVWAIGTGRAATVVEAERAGAAIRASLERLYDPGLAQDVSVLYGGSVSPENVEGYLALARLDGVLVGSGSLDAGEFRALMREAGKVRERLP